MYSQTAERAMKILRFVKGFFKQKNLYLVSLFAGRTGRPESIFFIFFAHNVFLLLFLSYHNVLLLYQAEGFR